MALFNNFFQTKRCVGNAGLFDASRENDLIPFMVQNSQIRVLLFRECERRGKELLFDSHDDKCNSSDDCRCNLKKNVEKRNKEDGVGVQCKAANSEAILLGEMIFGSVAMKCKGMSFKIHLLESPQRLLCTKVYNLHKSACSISDPTALQYDETTHSKKPSPWPSFSANSQLPLTSLNNEDYLTVNCYINKSDSGYSSHPSSHCSIDRCQCSFYGLWGNCEESCSSESLSFGSSYCNDTMSPSSTQWNLRHFENQTIVENISKTRKDSQASRSSRNNSVSENFDYCNRHISSKRIKLGIAFLITLADETKSKMLTFLMDHAILIEGALARLKHAIQQALCRPQLFTHTMSVASHQAIRWLVDLLSSPRIHFPVWSCLSSINKGSLKRKVADIFMRDFCSLLSSMDTKDTCFFMSTLLTNILTFHLGWVNSVSPYSSQHQLESTNSTKCSSYNPLQIQLGEMYGVIGLPSKVSRTIVYGKQNTILIRKVLMVLTYFIRCVNVKRYEYTYISRESVENILNHTMPSDVCHLVNKSSANVVTENNVKKKMFPNDFNQSCNDDDELLQKSQIFSDTTSNETTLCVPQTFLTQYSNNSEVLPPNVISVTSVNNKKPANNGLYKNSISKQFTNLNKICDIESNNVDSQVKTLCRSAGAGLLPRATSDSDCQVQLQLPSETSSALPCNDMTSRDGVCTALSHSVQADSKNVVFILGEDEELVGLKDSKSNLSVEQSTDVENKDSQEQSNTKDVCIANNEDVVQSESCVAHSSQCKHSSFKKHSGVKFDFEKYPQIVTNYMKSKNIEFLDRHVIGKPGNLKFVECQELESESNIRDLPKECDTCQNCSFTGQALQTPSNASELEYTSDIPDHDFQYAKECLVATSDVRPQEDKVFVKRKLSNTVVVNKSTDIVPDKMKHTLETLHEDDNEKLDIEMPLLSSSERQEDVNKSESRYCNSLFGSVSDHYISDLVLQGGVGGTKSDWEKSLFRDLKLQPGATCLLADIDEWSVRVFGSGGGGAGDMSALVASMLDCIPQMCQAKVPSFQCLAYIEWKLREICIRSKSLAQLLIDKDFCDMDYLTKTLSLEPNDVPLLLAIASTHSPQAALKYGVSYR